MTRWLYQRLYMLKQCEAGTRWSVTTNHYKYQKIARPTPTRVVPDDARTI